MARMVKCKKCGKQISQTDAYKHIHTTSGGKTQNHYYCSQEEFETIERDKELYRLCQYSTDEILGRAITNNVRNKELMKYYQEHNAEIGSIESKKTSQITAAWANGWNFANIDQEF